MIDGNKYSGTSYIERGVLVVESSYGVKKIQLGGSKVNSWPGFY